MVAKPGQMENSFISVWELMQQVKQFGFTEPEFERAKSSLLSGLESAVKEKDKVNSENLVQEYTRNFLVGEPAPGIEVEYELTKELSGHGETGGNQCASAQFIFPTATAM